MVECSWDGCGVGLEKKPGRGRNPKWCDAHRLATKRAASPDSATSECARAGCERMVRARGVCNLHYKRLLRAEGKLSSEWDDRRRANWHKRRALLKGATVATPFSLEDVISRGGTDCGLCGNPVDLGRIYPDPLSKSLDHVIPLSRGGAHSVENCQLAHLRCNVSKGARVV